MKYFKAGILSVILHVLVIGGVLFYAVLRGCLFKKQKVELVEFTIAVDPVEEEPPPAPKEPEPPKPEPKPEPKPDDIALQKKPDPPKKKPDPPKEQKKPDPPKKKDPPKIEKGRRIVKNPVVKSPVKPKEKQTLSDEEIKKWLGKRVKIGETTSLPKNDLSLNFSLIKNALYDAWNQPSREAAGFRPAEIAFSVGSGGRIQNPRLQTSSGSAVFDQSVLDAARRAGSIPGLSAEFLREYRDQDLVIEFKLSD